MQTQIEYDKLYSNANYDLFSNNKQMNSKQPIPPIQRQKQPQSSDQYLNTRNIVQGLPVISQTDNFSAQTTQHNQSQATQFGKANFLPNKSLTQVHISAAPQPTNQTLQQKSEEPDPNRPHVENHLIFTLRIWGFSALYFFLFCAIIFVQRFLYGYSITYALYSMSYIILLMSNLLAHRGSKKIQVRKLKWSLGVLAFFLIFQLGAFVYAVMYPIRYSFTNPAVNDAINDYQNYISAQHDADDDPYYRRRILISESYDMYEICQTLKTLYEYELSTRSYSSYCNDILNGQDDSSPDRLAPLQIGLLLYYIVALIAAFPLTYLLGKRAYLYMNYLQKIVKFTVIQTGQSVFAKSKKRPPNKY